MREHGGVTLSTRDKSSSHHVAVALLQQQQPNGHGKQLLQLQHADSPRTPRRPSDGCSSWRARLLSRKLVALWLLGLGLASCFAIRHGTRLLDAAGQQHHLLHLQPHGFGKHAEASIAAAAAAGAAAATQRQSASASSSGTAAAGNASSSPAAVLVAQRAKWPDGYVAVCAVVKDQWPDLRYWIEYHRWLGVSKFYIYDNNSTLPSLLQLWDYLQDGTVEYQYFLGRPRRKPDFTDTNQYRAYQSCLLQHFKQHRWMAYIDADEFLVMAPPGAAAGAAGQADDGGSSSGAAALHLPRKQQGLVNLQGAVLSQESVGAGVTAPDADTLAAAAAAAAAAADGGGPDSSSSGRPAAQDSQQHSLPVFLADFESHAAIGVNWVLFGSSGQQTRPPDGPLASYTSCVPRTHWESTHVKIIANTGGILGMGYTPHEVIARPGRATVDVDQLPFRGPRTPEAKWHKLVLHHYVLKSRAEFVAKKARGSGAGNRKDWAYWEYIEKLSNQTCSAGLAVSEAFFASGPQLALPQRARLADGCHGRAAAAYGALLKPVDASSEGGRSGSSGATSSSSSSGPADGGSADALIPC